MSSKTAQRHAGHRCLREGDAARVHVPLRALGVPLDVAGVEGDGLLLSDVHVARPVDLVVIVRLVQLPGPGVRTVRPARKRVLHVVGVA